MTDTTHPSREFLAQQLPAVLREWLAFGIDEGAQRLEDDDDRDGITRHISSVSSDDTGRIAVKTYGGDLFFFRFTLTEL